MNRRRPGTRSFLSAPRTATAVRFLAGGAANTLATLLAYWALLPIMGPQWAYASSFAAGIALGYLINTMFVFRARRTLRNLALVPLVYLAAYAAGAGTLEIAVSRMGVDPRAAPLLSLAVAVPLTFVLMRCALRRDADPPDAARGSD